MNRALAGALADSVLEATMEYVNLIIDNSNDKTICSTLYLEIEGLKPVTR